MLYLLKMLNVKKGKNFALYVTVHLTTFFISLTFSQEHEGTDVISTSLMGSDFWPY